MEDIVSFNTVNGKYYCNLNNRRIKWKILLVSIP